MHEAQISRSSTTGRPNAAFLTLTYNDRHVPSNFGLRRDDLTNFFKRLRHLVRPFRYLASGEYGTLSHRPHYHALIFGEDFLDDSIPLRENASTPDTRGAASRLRVSAACTRAWTHTGAKEPLGFHSIGELTWDSAAYVAAYTTKKATGELAGREYVNAETGEVLEPEFAVSSRGGNSKHNNKGGIGKPWFDRYWREVYPSNYVVLNGRQFQPPDYYDKLLERKDPELHREMILSRQKEITNNYHKYTPQRLEAKLKIQQQKHRQRKTGTL